MLQPHIKSAGYNSKIALTNRKLISESCPKNKPKGRQEKGKKDTWANKHRGLICRALGEVKKAIGAEETRVIMQSKQFILDTRIRTY